jgi:hypothetical protein
MVVSPASNIAAVIGVTWFSLLLETFIESVTFAGQTATFIQLVQNNAGVSEQYYVKGVAAGSRTLQVVWEGNVTAVAGIEVMNDVDQTTPIGNIATAANSVISGSASVALVADSGNWVADNVAVARPGVTNVSVNASQTQRWQLSAGSGANQIIGAGSTKESSGGSQTMQWSISPNRFWAICASEVRAAVTAPTVSISGYTSYDYPADPTPLESYKDPAAMQKIWNGDRRWMRED